MNAVVIESTHDFVDGGCNACPTVKCTTYSLKYKGMERSLDQLDVVSLVKELAMFEGFRQKLVMDFDEEYVQFCKGEQLITVVEADNQIIYKTRDNTYTLSNPEKTEDHERVFAAVNQILTELYQVEPLSFIEKQNE
ncbi:DUF4809 family protein [Enterococcus camelliae]|uniref:DUF4809 family protein n=1 Tax=Enterococcus camelliae TaxID=453959 RepID=A0ABW5TL99_9ENTE